LKNSSSDSAGVRVPPPFIYLAGLLLGIFGGRYVPGGLPREPWLVAAGLLIFALGIVLALSAIMRFRSAGNDPNPNVPVNDLVVDGPFRLTRNPMYVGLALVYAAIALWTASLWALLLLVVVMLVIRYGVVAREERYMARRFGDAYLDYMKRVRRWV
jgi:protein-S-isoprenylcysteine O-methyltransferase Ste14